MRNSTWIFGAAISALIAPAAGAAAQEDAATEQSVAPEVQALIDEIDAISEGDQSRDPEGDLAKLEALQQRVDAIGGLPPLDMANFASAFGASYFYIRDYDRSIEYYTSAQVYLEQGGAPPEEIAALLNNQATILGSIGKFDEAEAAHRRALAIRQEIEGERGAMVSSSLFGLGYVHYRRGQVEESIPFFRDSVEQQLEFSGPDDPNTIIRVTSLASVLGRSGREAEALQVARQAQSLGREHLGEDHPTYAITLNNLGNALVENALYNEAIPVLRETLRLRLATIGPDASGTAISLRNLGTALKQIGALEEAETLHSRATEIFEQSGETDTPDALGYMYADLANYAALRGDRAEYDRLSSRAREEADRSLGEEDHNRAHIHLYHAEWLLKRGEYTDALAIAERWVPVMQAVEIPQHKDRIWAELLLSRLRQLTDPSANIFSAVDETIGNMRGKLSDLNSTDIQLLREAEASRDSSIAYLQIAMSADDPARVFEALQLYNISDLALGQQRASEEAKAQTGAAAARAELLDLARAESQLDRRYANALEAQDGEKITALTGELELARAAREAAEQALRRDFPDYVARYRPAPVRLAELQASLAEDEMLMMPVEGSDRGWAVTLTREGGLGWHDVNMAELRGHVAAIRASVDIRSGAPGEFARDDAAALFAMLFPVGLDGHTKLLVHGGHSLASLPLSMLLTEGHAGDLADAPWLVRQASVQVVGNLALRARQAEPQPRGQTIRVAGIGGADLPSTAEAGGSVTALFRSGRPALESIDDLPALPGAAAELRAIADALPGDDDLILVGPDAAEGRFKQADLSNARIIAFATHGLVAGEMRGLWEPALLLGRSGEDDSEDGLLGASEIARLDLDADWVILSACNTAAGDGAGAPAFSGLATAFSQAGARALMLSHWRVRDDAAARLSVETVRASGESGVSRAEAMRRAQLAMIADTDMPGASHPAIWAPFVIIEN